MVDAKMWEDMGNISVISAFFPSQEYLTYLPYSTNLVGGLNNPIRKIGRNVKNH